MSVKKKRLLILAGIIVFAALIIALILFAGKQRDASHPEVWGRSSIRRLGRFRRWI